MKCGHLITTCGNVTLCMSGEQCFGQGQKIDGIVTGHGCLAAMEHKAGIEWISGLRLRSRCLFGPGHDLDLGIDTCGSCELWG